MRKFYIEYDHKYYLSGFSCNDEPYADWSIELKDAISFYTPLEATHTIEMLYSAMPGVIDPKIINIRSFIQN